MTNCTNLGGSGNICLVLPSVCHNHVYVENNLYKQDFELYNTFVSGIDYSC